MSNFANLLYQNGIITEGGKDSKDFDTMLSEFICGMDYLQSVTEYEEHCTKLLDTLTALSGNARRASNVLRQAWITAVKQSVGIDFLKA